MPPSTTLRAVALVVTLSFGCLTGPPPLTSTGDGEGDASSSATDTDASEAGTVSADASTQGSASMSSTSATASATGMDASATDTSGTTEDNMGPCGDLGQVCCDEAVCVRGMCHDGTCVAFRGVFADPHGCDGCEDIDHLPTLSTCDCDGFVQSDPFEIYSDTCMPKLPFTATNLFTCQAALDGDTTGSDWGGAHLRIVDSPCGEIVSPCVVPNAYTGECDCPSNMDEIVAGLDGPCPTGGTAKYELVICSSNVTPPINFGGAYETQDPATQDAPEPCLAGNPRADGGGCGCPAGFEQQGLRIINSLNSFGGTLYFCVGTP